jgi:hypothetical protein
VTFFYILEKIEEKRRSAHYRTHYAAGTGVAGSSNPLKSLEMGRF